MTREGQTFSRQSGVTLRTLQPNTASSRSVLAGLTKLRNLKQTRCYPWMPVAKFTHFFNPTLFPIYDMEVIWKKVLYGVFKRDWIQWCEVVRAQPIETDTESARFNLDYTLMAAEIIRNADEGFMPFFSEWFREQVAGEGDDRRVLDDVDSYYATAFEYVAIGAAHV